MTALLTAPKTSELPARRNRVRTPVMCVVIVAPAGQLVDCQQAMAAALARGAAAYPLEVPLYDDDPAALGTALDAIGAAVDEAIHTHPGVPIVLVGHSTAGLAVEVFADLCPDDLCGAVLTDHCESLSA